MGADPSWNVFRYVGDFLHLFGMILGVSTVVGTRSVEGFSAKTQVIYQLVYCFRYLDVFLYPQAMYLVTFKITFNLLTVAMLVGFFIFRASYDAAVDSCNLLAIVLPATIAAHVASSGGLVDELWTLSEFLEPLALVPQYIVCYRARRVRGVALLYVVAVGGYRVLYVFNWLYKRSVWHSAYHDYVSWVGGGLECLLFADFVCRMVRSRREVLETSFLGSTLLDIDESAGRISEKIEMRALGRRLPFGMSGGSASKDLLDGRRWDSGDRIAEEEECGLLTLDGDVDGY